MDQNQVEMQVEMLMDGMKQHGRLAFTSEVMEKIVEIGTDKFPDEFKSWMGQQALNNLQSVVDAHRTSDMMS